MNDKPKPIHVHIVKHERDWMTAIKCYTHCSHLGFIATRRIKLQRWRQHLQTKQRIKLRTDAINHKNSNRLHERTEKLVSPSVGLADIPRTYVLRQPSAPELFGR